jgi:isoleucyl-tRNA synthetase
MSAPYKPVSSKVDFAALETSILDFWDKNDIFKKSSDPARFDKSYRFYDGPPFATGLPHYGHLLAGIIKDIVPRFWTMRGYHVERRFGWDCHGLPVEFEMEKELDLNGKHEIENYGIDRFNEDCRGIVLRYTAQWQDTVKRIGRWVDFDNDYKTMDPEFMESIWWVFKSLWDKGLVYEGHKVMPYCPRCTTVLSNFETNQGYKDTQDPAITVRFKLVGEEKSYIIAWTTTPWTLPSNVALATGADIDYIQVKDSDGDSYIMAKARLSSYFKDENEYEVVKEFKGSELKGRAYEPLFDCCLDDIDGKKAYEIVNAEFVSTEDGTGIVHIAPAFGEDDYAVAQDNDMAFICTVDDQGCVTKHLPEFEGMFVKDADKGLIKQLKNEGKLVHQATVQHSYPFCWRCDSPLIYRAVSTWFVNIEKIKDKMLAANAQTSWVPSHLKDGRFGKWLSGARDWAISRNRYWGSPIPIWRCEACDAKKVMGSIDDLQKECGHEVADIHKHFVDKISLTCECGGTMQRVSEVLDCWFESGSMPYAQMHYPFENQEAFENNFPADFVAEGLDQTRGWFYTLTVLGAALFEKPAFKNVIVNGLILAEDGKKMSKRLKNYPAPDEVMHKYGAEALRLYLINSPVVRGESLKFSEDGIGEIMRQVLLPLWNSYSFFTTYANIDGWKPGEKIAITSDMDRWIMSRMQTLVKEVNEEMEAYRLYRVVDSLVSFIDDLTNWYIRRSRRRFWKSEDDGDKMQAYQTLHSVLVELCHILAPFLPFVSEEIYDNLVKSVDPDAEESIHLCAFPSYDQSMRDEALEEEMAHVMRTVEMGRALRSTHDLRIRQPLGTVTVISRDPHVEKMCENHRDIILGELNIKDLHFSSDEASLVDLSAKANFKELGRKLGKNMKAAASVIAAFDGAVIAQLQDGGTTDIEVNGETVTLGLDDIVVHRSCKEGTVIETDQGITVAIDTTITDELRIEGTARELVNRVQNLRKEAGFEVADRITMSVTGGNEDIAAAIETYGEYLCAETLCQGIVESAPANSFVKDEELLGSSITIALAQVS